LNETKTDTNTYKKEYTQEQYKFNPETSSLPRRLELQKHLGALSSGPQVFGPIEEHVSKILKKILDANNITGSYNIRIEKSKEFQAYAEYPNTIVITTGVLDKTENDAQLALLIGHELSHLVRNDTLKSIELINKSLSVLGIKEPEKLSLRAKLSLTFDKMREEIITTDPEANLKLEAINYLRLQIEPDADIGGATFAAKAGYKMGDKGGGAELFLLEEFKQSGGGSNDHPPGEYRYKVINAFGLTQQKRNPITDYIVGAESYKKNVRDHLPK
jgi:Peptidase family M48